MDSRKLGQLLLPCLIIGIAYCLGVAYIADPIELPFWEKLTIAVVANEYGLEGEPRLLLYAIRKIENGGPGREFGVMNDKADTFIEQARWAAGTIKKRFTGDYDAFADRYCPPEVDPEGNANWKRNIRFYMEKWK